MSQGSLNWWNLCGCSERRKSLALLTSVRRAAKDRFGASHRFLAHTTKSSLDVGCVQNLDQLKTSAPTQAKKMKENNGLNLLG
jgi:hypothetical protein